MNRLQYLLCKLAEEAAEVSQIALKTSYFGLDEHCPFQPYTNKERLNQEISDFISIVSMLNDEYNLSFKQDEKNIILKQMKVNKYYGYSKQLGLSK